MNRCEHGIADRACPECHPSQLEPPVPIEPAGEDIDALRGQLYATQCLLIAERERVTRLERELEYEAFIANREFWATL